MKTEEEVIKYKAWLTKNMDIYTGHSLSQAIGALKFINWLLEK